ncbi:MAG TPA: Wzz/FepE/Etk N-terminal domain-containing protein [Candidatus Binatia bacterium]|nr:Wzz/FepE/Etk N-terminal domain-containing protein [Candidatus Binatia bacterium]
MEFKDYVRILRQRGWLIILLAVLTAGAAFGFSRMQTPVYEASARLLITSRPDFGQAQAVRIRLRDMAAWLNSSLRAQDVIDQLKLDMRPQALLGDVTVAAATSESIIQINVENTDPSLAQDIARVWAEQLIELRRVENADLRAEDRIEAELIDNPTVSLESPQTTINTAAGAVFGALLGIVVIFIIEWLESGVLRRAEDVERYLEIPVIGRIPQQ